MSDIKPLADAAGNFLGWFETFIGKETFAEIRCDQLDALRREITAATRPVESRWRCPCCKSLNVQVSLPTWYYESVDHDLIFADTDAEADISWWYCQDCDETDNGQPEDVLDDEVSP